MPNRIVFLDTNGWLALLNASDTLHGPAVALWEELVEQGATLVVTDWVLAETGNGLARTPARRQLGRAVDLFRSSFEIPLPLRLIGLPGNSAQPLRPPRGQRLGPGGLRELRCDARPWHY